jgi:microfibrillar-associated protein 1
LDSIDARLMDAPPAAAAAAASVRPVRPQLQVRGTRYRAGQAPSWAAEALAREEEEEEEEGAARSASRALEAAPRRPAPARVLAGPAAAPRPRAKAEIIGAAPATLHPREPLAAPKVEEAAVGEGEHEAEARRARARARMLEAERTRGTAEAAALWDGQEEEAEEAEAEEARPGRAETREESEDEEEEEDEEEDDEEGKEEDESGRPAFRPAFVSREQRVTVAEREARAAEADAEAEAAAQRRDEIRKESKLRVAETLAEEEAAARAAQSSAVAGTLGAELLGERRELPDDSDERSAEDMLAEIQAWRLRERARVQRDERAARAQEEEAKELERRRGLSDAEIAAEDRANPAKQKAERGKMKFLQRYYHKGAFFQDEEREVFQRDFNAPTGLDAEIDKSALPAPLQAKKVGFRSQTKYTHLVAEDTTSRERNPWLEAERWRQDKRRRT